MGVTKIGKKKILRSTFAQVLSPPKPPGKQQTSLQRQFLLSKGQLGVGRGSALGWQRAACCAQHLLLCSQGPCGSSGAGRGHREDEGSWGGGLAWLWGKEVQTQLQSLLRGGFESEIRTDHVPWDSQQTPLPWGVQGGFPLAAVALRAVVGLY